MAKVLFDALAEALATGQLERKLALVRALAADWRAGALSLEDGAPVPPVTERGYPAKPKLVAAQDVPQRKPSTREGLAALFHAIVHIEWSAIDLALDHAFRFRAMPAGYYGDWISVAEEEALHFDMLRAHLQSYGHDYGDFPAHDTLWQLNVRTSADVLARMALVPRLAEARGLDATPPIQAKLKQTGDAAGAAVLDVVLNDEVGHVALGDKWFRHLCAERKLEVEPTYRRLIGEYQAPWPVAPLNEKARLAAGFSADELQLLAAGGRR
ncbi:MAG TPA: ferritin-like domain-containing protein [Rhodocyclaceae bacterium]|nr:ferritin-like domain-containing protein [Rhodocyclaceae bacterium]